MTPTPPALGTGIRHTTLPTCDLTRSRGRGALPPACDPYGKHRTQYHHPQQKIDSTGNAPETVVLYHLASQNSLQAIDA